jgi:hypothetical protein
MIAPQTCIRWIIEIQTMMQLFASAAKLRGGGPILQGGIEAMCRRGSPLPRMLTGYRQSLAVDSRIAL